MSAVVVAVVAAVSFGAIAAAISAIVYPHARPWIRRLSGERRSAIVLGVLAAPLVGGVVLSLLALLPGVAGLVWPGLDHCTHHDDLHFHLCLVHAPALSSLGLSVALIVAALVPPALRLGSTVVRVRRARRVVRALDGNACIAAQGSHAVVESDVPFALTAGLLVPRIFVTSALIRDLDPVSTAAMLAHEAAHVSRKDPLRKLIGELFSALHFPGARRLLLDDLSLACEESCDEQAARAIGDRADVAAALVALGRLIERAPKRLSLVGAGFGDANIETRVLSLLAPPKVDAPIPGRAVWVAGGTVIAAVLVVPLHHATETLLGLLLG